jgi:hypothetical protein
MRRRHIMALSSSLAVLAPLTIAAFAAEAPPAAGKGAAPDVVVARSKGTNQLTKKERAAGWTSLFDGKTLDAWRLFKGEAPTNWAAEDGTIAWKGDGGDLTTKEQFGDFELSLEWKISPGGNSGVMFHVSEAPKFPWETGPEMQILDDSHHGDGKNASTAAGANYALHAAEGKKLKPVGQWNQARLVVKGDKVEHWLNGKKIVSYTMWDEAWKAKVAASKFAKMPGYGMQKSGHIVLQDHGNPVWFRNVKLRSL